jgi:hypothetical protein
MLKRMNWAVYYGGGEYGSEDSEETDSDSDSEAEEELGHAPKAQSWAEAMEGDDAADEVLSTPY